MQREHLIDDELVLITPQDSTLTFGEVIERAGQSSQVAFALDSVEFSLGRFFQAFCRQHGIEPNVLFETPDPFLQTHLVRAGHACSVTSALFAPLQPGVRFVHLPDRPHRTLYTAVRAGREQHRPAGVSPSPRAISIRHGHGSAGTHWALTFPPESCRI